MKKSILYTIAVFSLLILLSGCVRGGYVPLEDMNIDYKTMDKQENIKNFPREKLFYFNVPGPDEPLMHKKKSKQKQKRLAKKRSKKMQWEKWPPKKGFFSWLIFWK